MRNLSQFLKIGLLFLICAFALGAHAQSLPAYGQAAPSVHMVKFKIHQDVVAGLTTAEIGRRLSQYVADLNEVYTRETVRSFKFDPTTDIQISSTTDCPWDWSNNYILICVKKKSTLGYSHGGGTYAYPNPFRGIIVDFEWVGIHDPTNLSDVVQFPNVVPTREDYLKRHLRTLIHEFEHVFQAGIPDIYLWSRLYDLTGVSPKADVDINNVADPFWLDRRAWRKDPLMGGPSSIDRPAYLGAVRFSKLTKTVINTNWIERPGVGAFMNAFENAVNATRVNVKDSRTGAAIGGANIMIFKPGSDGNTTKAITVLHGQGMSDASGNLSFSWNCPFVCGSLQAGTFLIKVWKTGYVPSVQWLTYHDVVEQMVVHGKTQAEVNFKLAPADAIPPVINMNSSQFFPNVNYIVTNMMASDPNGNAWSYWGNFRDVILMANGAPVERVCESSTAKVQSYCYWTPERKGTHHLQLIARDYAGNVTMESQSVQAVFSDNVPPTMTLIPPTLAHVNYNVWIHPQVSDNVSVYDVGIYVNGRKLGSANASLGYQYSWVPTELGPHNVEVRVLDGSQNSVSKSFTINVVAQ